MPSAALVVGVGAQGLLMCLALQRRNVDVYVTDVKPERAAFATANLGATALEPTADRLFELVVDTTGLPAAMAAAVSRSDTGGTIVELGLENRPLDLDAETLVRRQLILRGSLTYDHPRDYEWATSLVNAKAISPGRVISDEHPFADSQRAFETSPTASGKTWIRMTSR